MRFSKPFPVFAALSALLLLLLYSPFFHSQFVYDDVTLIAKNGNLAHWSGVLGYFRKASPFGEDFGGGPASYYRPLTWFSFGVDHWLFNNLPAGFHLTSLALDWVDGLLGCALLLRLRVEWRVAAAAVLLWLALPVNTEAVAWISARSYSLMFCFVLLGLHALARYFEDESWLQLVAFYLAALGAAFSHETGLLLLPLAFGIFIWRYRQVRAWAWVIAAAALAGAGYLAARAGAGGSAPGIHPVPSAIGQYVADYLSWLLLPVRMSMERSTDTPPGGFGEASLLYLAGLAGLLGLTEFLRRRAPEAAAGLLWMWISLLPVCGFVVIYQGMAERYLYLPSAGLSLALVSLTYRWKGKGRGLLLTLLGVWALWGAWRTYARASEWTNEQSLFTSSLEATPRSWVLWLNLGNVFLEKRDLPEAVQAFSRALAVNPKAVKALDNLATARLMQGDTMGAEKAYRQAIAIRPERPDSYSDLGVVLFDEGRVAEAEHMLQTAVRLGPANPTAYFDLGVLYAHSGRREQAAAMYRLALALNPDYPDAQRGLELLDEARK